MLGGFQTKAFATFFPYELKKLFTTHLIVLIIIEFINKIKDIKMDYIHQIVERIEKNRGGHNRFMPSKEEWLLILAMMVMWERGPFHGLGGAS